MDGDSSAAQAAYLSTLGAAVEAAQDAFFAAAAHAGPADQPNLKLLMDALDHTKAAYNSALKESLVNNSAFVQAQRSELDKQIAAIKAQIETLEDIDEWLKLVGDVAKLAASIATAFG